ncbi:MAG: heparan-alpha-glucosaminide N-acetyltransferase domain-containing protein, partial [Steroidobacter sp.]
MSTTTQQDRIDVIDALRGYALMGLFIVHMVEYFELYWYSEPAVTQPVTTWVFRLFSGKSYAIFAMLFGVSFYIILQRNADRGTDFRWRFLWRVTLLFMIGYLHGLIYSGEVLQILAIGGMLLLPLWTAPSWMVVAISILLLLQTTTYGFVAWLGYSDIPYEQSFYLQFQKPVYAFYAHGNFFQVIASNAVGGTLGKWSYMLESGRFANVIGLSMLGFWLARIKFFT